MNVVVGTDHLQMVEIIPHFKKNVGWGILWSTFDSNSDFAGELDAKTRQNEMPDTSTIA